MRLKHQASRMVPLGIMLLLSFFLWTNREKVLAESSGVIRVLLSSASESTALDVEVYGAYLLDERISFQRGSKLSIRSQGNLLVLYYEGSVYRTTGSVRLLRHSANAEDENGLRLNGTLPLYEGDLFVDADGGRLRTVLHIGIEDYLQGVVPYEMSDEFPLEALKAQAVAARSYALLSIRGDRSFDVYDTTSDQVFRGYLPEHPNASRAIRETEGMGLNYQGKLAQAFYTASNGGQVEASINAWGREDIPYLQVKLDPYDLQNPLSIVRTAAIPMDGVALQNTLPWLYEMLVTAAVPAVESLGYPLGSEEIVIRSVMDLEAVLPMYPQSGSMVMTTLRFTLQLGSDVILAPKEEEVSLFASQAPGAGDDIAGTAQGTGPNGWTQLVSVDLAHYPQVEQQLDLSINIKQNETLRVRKSETGYELLTARYGHGVGMSQRGAQWQAEHEGWTYEQILGFYYPGTALTHYATLAPSLPALSQDYLTTPGPRPTATPRPTPVPVSATAGPGEWIAIVDGIGRNSSLNLRAHPSTNGDILYQLFYGQELLVHGRAEEGWLQVSTDGLSGFVMEEFVTKKQSE